MKKRRPKKRTSSAKGKSRKKSSSRIRKNAAGKQPRNKADKAKHLKPHRFKPGQSGNPTGRPKGSYSLVRIMRQMIREPYKGPDAKKGETQGHRIIRAAIEQAAKGNNKHLITLLERLEGKVPDRLSVDHNPLLDKSDEELDALLADAPQDEEGEDG